MAGLVAVTLCLMLTAALLLLGTVAALHLPHPDGIRPVAIDPGGTVTALGGTAYALRVVVAAGYIALWLSALASVGIMAVSPRVPRPQGSDWRSGTTWWGPPVDHCPLATYGRAQLASPVASAESGASAAAALCSELA